MFQHVETTPPARSHRELQSNPPCAGIAGTPTVRVSRAEAPLCHASARLKRPSAPPATEPLRGQTEQGCSRASPPRKFTQTQLCKAVFGDIAQMERRSGKRPESCGKRKSRVNVGLAPDSC